MTRRWNDARQGDKSAIELNEALRSIDCIENPQHYIETLLNFPEIKQDDYFQNILSSFYVDSDISKKIRLCTKESNRKILTDLADGDRVYKPYESILPKYHKGIYHKLSTANAVLKPIFNLEKTLTKEMLPHPAMLPMFKGNVGEYMFKQCLNVMNITPLTVDDMFIRLESTVYELFDFYVISENELFCIDVKNWSATFDKEELASETHEKALRKRKTLMEIAERKSLSASFVYVNTHQDRNSINSKQEFGNGGNISYMNLFKVMTQYEETVPNDKFKYKPDPKKKSSLKDRLNINSSLIQLLGGTLNG
jgi:hypothetical protein